MFAQKNKEEISTNQEKFKEEMRALEEKHKNAPVNTDFTVYLKKAKEIEKLLTSKDGYRKLREMSPFELEKIFNSQEFCYVVAKISKEYEDGNRGIKYENFKNNISSMIMDKYLLKVFGISYRKSVPQRLAVGIILNSRLGKEIVSNTIMTTIQVLRSLPFPLNLKEFYKRIENFRKFMELTAQEVDEESQQKYDWQIFKLPESPVKLNEQDRLVLKQLGDYIYYGRGDINRILSNERNIVNIMRSSEGRGLFKRALENEKSRQRLKEIITGEKGRELLLKSMETVEGLNLISYLWNTTKGRNFVFSLAKTSKGAYTLYLIARKQNETHAKLIERGYNPFENIYNKYIQMVKINRE